MGEIKLPFKWKNVSFGEVCTLGKESVQPTDNPNINYVGLEHIDPGNPNLTRWGIASEVRSSKSKFYPGDVLYGKLRPYLDKAVLANFEGICSTDILVFKAKELIKPQFLRNFIIPVAPLPEQYEIASVWQACDRKISALEKEIAILDELFQAMLEQLMTGKISTQELSEIYL
jgi:type I restriction enzyme, S subunit